MDLRPPAQQPIRTSLDSSCVQSVSYSDLARTMEISFHNGTTYRYFGVPASIHRTLLSATSKGRYFAAAIRTRFRFERVS